MANTDIITRDCVICGNAFERTRSGSKIHCSVQCRFLEISRKIIPDENGCWIWPNSKNVVSGYGQFSVWDNGKRQILTAHRLAYQLLVGPIENGKMILHKCDVRACCNPQHLYVGDQFDNMRDMWSRGRNGDVSSRLKKAWITRRAKASAP